MPAPLINAILAGGASPGAANTFTLSVTDITAIGGGSSTAAITVERGGDLTFLGTPTGDDAAEWVTPRNATIGDGYEARLTVNIGSSPTTGTVNTWLAVSSDLTWNLVRTVAGSTTGNWTLEIRRASGSGVASTTFDITATVT